MDAVAMQCRQQCFANCNGDNHAFGANFAPVMERRCSGSLHDQDDFLRGTRPVARPMPTRINTPQPTIQLVMASLASTAP